MEVNIAVLAHDAAAPTVETFWHQWEKLPFAWLRVYLPEGSGDRIAGYRTGKDAHRGKDCVQRFIASVEHALAFSSGDYLCVMEYDTLNLTDKWPKLNPYAVNCGLFHLINPDRTSTGNHCALSPWIATRPQWRAAIEAMKLCLSEPFPEWTEGGLLDRVIGHALVTHSVQAQNLTELLAYPWIEDAHKKIVTHNISWVHGWKTKEDFGPLFPL